MSPKKSDSIKIRPLKKADIPAALALWQAVDMYNERSDTPQALWRKARREDGLFLVAEIQGEVVATVMGGYDGRMGTVGRLVVSPAHRRKGIAEKLMKELELRLVATGAPGATLLVWQVNKPAIALYKKLGYDVVEGLHFMKKRL